jgi:exodeoxyribonuclease VIII
MDNKTYHEMTHLISASMLKTASKSLAHYWNEYVNPDRKPKEPTRSMELGTCFHTVLLEPLNAPNVIAVVPDGIDRRTKEGKALFAEIEASGLIPLKDDEWQSLRAMGLSVSKHPMSGLFFDAILPHKIESVHTWTDDGIGMKMRTDYEIAPCETFPRGVIIDLKSAADASLNGFSKSAYNLGYHIQAAHYSVGFMDKHRTNEAPDVIFLAVEKDAPHVCQWFKADDAFMEYGYSERDRLITEIVKARETGKYQGYSDEVVSLELPAWVARQLENEEIGAIEYV